MKLFIIGGAGYVGSHFVHYADQQGQQCIVYDNFCRGHRQALTKSTTVIEGNILDTDLLARSISDTKPDVILHYAAFALVGESVTEPTLYYENNVQGVISMLKAMEVAAHFVPVVFSSSCAVFGTPSSLPMKEEDPKRPESPYGRSKLMAEEILNDAAKAKDFPVLALRYFNACGADPSGAIGEDHSPESHLLPNAIKAALYGLEMQIFGNDFPTEDGTCVRDYIHVTDLAEAHLLACEKMKQPTWPRRCMAINLGTGHGYSNLEILKQVEQVVGKKIPYTFAERRPGDPPALYAANAKAKDVLNFVPSRSDLKTIIESAAAWHKNHPSGFSD